MPRDPTSAPDRKTIVRAEFSGTPDGVRDALRKIRSGLTAFQVGGEEAFSAELVIAEALNNVVEHALEGTEHPVFRLSLRQSQNGVLVEIRDRGRPMPADRPPLGAAPSLSVDPAALPEGGFGWFLIRELARDLEYRRIAGENRLSFRLAIYHTEPA